MENWSRGNRGKGSAFTRKNKILGGKKNGRSGQNELMFEDQKQEIPGKKMKEAKEGENRSANCTVNKQPPLGCGGKIPPQHVQLAVHTLPIRPYSSSLMNNSPLPPSIPLCWVSLPDQAAVGFLAAVVIVEATQMSLSL